VRLVLNQIGRRPTEDLQARGGRHRLLFMLDEFPALGRLDFFESALAFMACYGLKSFLVAQSLNQIEKAYGRNNAILENCDVRVSFATNDERTTKRVGRARNRDRAAGTEELRWPQAKFLARPSHGFRGRKRRDRC
jgi:type IV secretion system protein VirD4